MGEGGTCICFIKYMWKALGEKLWGKVFPFTLEIITWIVLFIKLSTENELSLIVSMSKASVLYCWLYLKADKAQLDAPSDWRPGRGFNPHQGRQHSFVEIDHELFSTVILSLPLIHDRVVSFWQKNMHNTG